MADKTNFQAALEGAHANVLKAVLDDKPSTTTAELRELVADFPALGELTLAQIFGGAATKARKTAPVKAAVPAPAAAPTKPTKAKGDGWNVRTEAGRDALQAAVLEALRKCGGKDVSASDMRSLGAKPAQLRTTLNRLIEDGAVTYTGQARGTRYSLL